MYRGNKYKSSLNHWYEWNDNMKEEELYYKIRSIVIDTIREELPQLIKDYQYNIETTINGESLEKNNIKDILTSQLREALTR